MGEVCWRGGLLSVYLLMRDYLAQRKVEKQIKETRRKRELKAVQLKTRYTAAFEKTLKNLKQSMFILHHRLRASRFWLAFSQFIRPTLFKTFGNRGLEYPPTSADLFGN